MVGVPCRGVQHRSGPLHQQHAQVPIAASADVAEAALAAGRVSARHQAEPGGELPAAFEVARIAYGGDYCHGGKRPDTANLHQPLRRLAGTGLGLDLTVVGADALIELHQVRTQILDRLARLHRQRLSGGHGVATHPLRSAGRDHAELGEYRAQPVDQRGALLDEALAHPVQGE